MPLRGCVCVRLLVCFMEQVIFSVNVWTYVWVARPYAVKLERGFCVGVPAKRGSVGGKSELGCEGCCFVRDLLCICGSSKTWIWGTRTCRPERQRVMRGFERC